MTQYIGYLQVSTRHQGHDRNGMHLQRDVVARVVAEQKGLLLRRFVGTTPGDSHGSHRTNVRQICGLLSHGHRMGQLDCGGIWLSIDMGRKVLPPGLSLRRRSGCPAIAPGFDMARFDAENPS